MTRLMIVGATGQLGRELLHQAPVEFDIWAGGANDLDITDLDAVQREMHRFRPTAVINAAAYTQVDKAESERDAAWRVNVLGPQNLAASCARNAARLVHISTDFVFDGAMSAPYAPDVATNPQSVYGCSKREGELVVRRLLPNASTVVRTSWLWSCYGNNFVKTMLRLLGQREQVGVVVDQVGTPTSAAGLAKATIKLVRSGLANGQIHHWTDSGVASWYDFAIEIRDLAMKKWPERPWGRVNPIYTVDYPTAARRPHYSVLDCRSLQTLLDERPLHWRHALRGQIDRFEVD